MERAGVDSNGTARMWGRWGGDCLSTMNLPQRQGDKRSERNELKNRADERKRNHPKALKNIFRDSFSQSKEAMAL